MSMEPRNKSLKEETEPEIDPEEIDMASERVSGTPMPPEISSKTENLTEWDQPPKASGEAAHKVLPEDETSAAEELVEEGIDEADRDQRIASADPDFEP